MKRETKLVAVATLVPVIGLFVFQQVSAQIPPGLTDRNRVATPLERLTWRVESLESKLDAANKALDSKSKSLESKIEGLRGENAGLRTQLSALEGRLRYVESDLQSPAGMSGLKRKIIQKIAWDRIPEKAWLVYYQF